MPGRRIEEGFGGPGLKLWSLAKTKLALHASTDVLQTVAKVMDRIKVGLGFPPFLRAYVERPKIGSGGSHRRTRLRFVFSLFHGRYREFGRAKSRHGDITLPSANKSKAFPTNSLGIETGNFAG